ncbi:hypothetical protein [Synechocystis salina]|nr:hypothetical protein [Synechocystis salina]
MIRLNKSFQKKNRPQTPPIEKVSGWRSPFNFESVLKPDEVD